MAFRWNFLTLLLVLVFITGSLGSGHKKGDHDHHEDKGQWSWGAAVGLAVIAAIFIGSAALFSLLAWCVCALHTKCRKDKIAANVIKIGSQGSTPPTWTQHLIYKPEMAAGFGLVSEGFTRIGPAHLVRNRPGTQHTDGARWAVGMTRGRHVFEVTWPWGHRGYHASIGLATEDAPIKSKGTTPLVGANAKTWGLDIVKRKAMHRNKAIMTCPTDGSYVPDKFLVYVDMEEGTLGFGNDVTYWGEVISGLPFQGTKPMYLMVGASKWQSELSVLYKGSAPDDAYYAAMEERRPHHLPPLYHEPSQDPPTYSEQGYNKTQGGPGGPGGPTTINVQPEAPPQDVMYEPPPPYSRPSSGHKTEDV